MQINIAVKATFTQVNKNHLKSSYLSQCFQLGRKSPYRIRHLRLAGHGKAAKAIKWYMGITVMWMDRISDRENDALQRQQ